MRHRCRAAAGRAVFWALAALWVSLTLPTGAQAAAHRLMVISIPGRAGAAFNGQVVAEVIHPLAERVVQVPGAEAHAAVVKSGLARPSFHLPRNAQRVGRLAGATHVLVIEAGGQGARQFVAASLVEVGSGRVVVSARSPLPHGQLTAQVAHKLIQPVIAKIGSRGPLVAAAAPPPPPPPAPMPAPPAPAPEAESADAAEAAPPKAGRDKKGAAKADEDPDDDDSDTDAKHDKPRDKGDRDDKADGGDEGEAEVAGAKGRTPRWRSPARIALGVDLLQRSGTLSAPALPTGVTGLPGYHGDNKNSNPFFPLINFGFDFFPLAIGGTGRAIEGLGLRADLEVTYIKSVLLDPNKVGGGTLIPSTLFGLKLAAAYRYVLWSSLKAPDVEVNLGLRLLAFPLTGGQFPGVTWTAPMLGLRFALPLGTPALALVGAGALDIALSAGGDAPGALSATRTQQSGLGYEIGGGLRVRYWHIELDLLARLEHYGAAFGGKANLANVPDAYQPTNVTMSDQYIGILAALGWVF